MYNIGDTVLYSDMVGVVIATTPTVIATNLGTDLEVKDDKELILISKAEDTIKEYRKVLLKL